MSTCLPIHVTNRWRRALLVAALVAFLSAGLLHSAHLHAPAKSGGAVHVELCAQCAAWGGMAGPPGGLAPRIPLAPLIVMTFLAVPLLRRRCPVSSARPRAPPRC